MRCAHTVEANGYKLRCERPLGHPGPHEDHSPYRYGQVLRTWFTDSGTFPDALEKEAGR